MKKKYFYKLIVIFQISMILAQSDGWDSHLLSTSTLDVRLSNSGVLDWYTDPPAIQHIYHPEWWNFIVFNHTIELTAYRSDSLIGVVNNYLIDYSPGPIINDSAAMQVSPENANDYRVYYINENSTSGDLDYDEWPVDWGAPQDENGNPKLYGTQTAFSVYNDAHTGDNYRGWPYTDPTMLQVSETVWSYDDIPLLDNTVFFRYRFINMDSVDYNDAIISLWSDVDITAPTRNWGGYNNEYNFMHCYFYATAGDTIRPYVAAYLLLQGPLVEEEGTSGIAFEQSFNDYKNLSVTAGWYIFDDNIYNPDLFGATPATLQDARFLAEGLMMNGNPIINPLTGDTTTYTFDGDPATGEGWLWDIATPQGGSGIISSSGPFSLYAGDSTEVIYAMVMTEGHNHQEGFLAMYDKVSQIYDWWDTHGLNTSSETIINPTDYQIINAYPNPFNGAITIDLILSHGTNKIIIYDLLGQIQYKKVIQGIHSNEYSIQWQPDNNQASGIYFVKISNSQLEKVKKVMYIK